MSVGFRPPSPHQDQPRQRQIRVLWRMQGPRKVAAAALYEHRMEQNCASISNPRTATTCCIRKYTASTSVRWKREHVRSAMFCSSKDGGMYQALDMARSAAMNSSVSMNLGTLEPGCSLTYPRFTRISNLPLRFWCSVSAYAKNDCPPEL
jgi:hypothetical protein